MQQKFKHLVFCLTAVVMVIFSTSYAFGKEAENSIISRMRLTELTLITGYGEGNVPEGIYRHILLTCHIGFDLKRFFPQLKNRRGVTSFFLEPKINPVLDPDTGIELGVSLGIKYRYPFNEKLSGYVFGSVGPHYITVETEDQADGFIFFDTIGTGLSFFLTKTSAVNVEYRFRHASNASTHYPNGGIDSHIGAVGYSIFF